MADTKRLPDAPGWWARRDDSDRIKWFKVVMLNDPPRQEALVPMIWFSLLAEHLPVTAASRPGTRWYGPVQLPETWDD